MRRLLRRGQLWVLTLAGGGGLFVLEGCDPAVRNTVLQGVSSAATSLSTTFIGAFFQSLLADEEGAATTVRAIIDTAWQVLA